MHITESEAFLYALKKISRADTTAYLLHKALRQKGFPEEEIEELVRYFASISYLNDERYATNYIMKHVAKAKKGPRLLYYELRSRGIEKELCKILITTLYTPEQEMTAIQNIIKKDKGKTKQMKLVARLERRGFRHSTIKACLHNLHN
ncbi:MAG: hypothetical protein A2Y62_04095 [Candidatus Fischerbacteria bacterium RBG_13_37_8]|uniref:Regulatory protein RecX n=1 Tax=Candidatus Fischerbacteria bacterium RBG_13_37_8 TaxID=1817863 RepID=A0A1F5V4S8_9BACT|nr:MAG: hypothetical protein A2Y62_04095 [Candidatus Fischerbacteria bacterium RBG_13_37_8]